MALNSPGVQVSIIDQSQYASTSASSVPLLIVATAQNKADATSTTGAVAAGTIKANANKLYQVTSQKDILTIFGSPFFYKTSNGTPIHGYELNEYGLMAAYSLMGVTNQAFILRADVDLASLVGTLSRPVGKPADGTYWLDSTNSAWGIYEFNASTGKFVSKTPVVITDSSLISNGYPVQTVSSIGTYVVIPTEIPNGDVYAAGTLFYKSYDNNYYIVGSAGWKKTVPFVVGTVSYPNSLNSGDRFTINVNSQHTVTINVDSGDGVVEIATKISAAGDEYLTAWATPSGNLAIAYGSPEQDVSLTFTASVGSVLYDLGIFADPSTTTGTFYAPDLVFGTSAAMPLWTKGQQRPHPTGSVWVKTSVTGSGMNLKLSKYSSVAAAFQGVNVGVYDTLGHAVVELDSAAGGANIPVDTVVAITGGTNYGTSGLALYRKAKAGVTEVIGTATNINITSARQLKVIVGDGLSMVEKTLTISGTATNFVRTWQAANIPNTTASIDTNNAIVLTHTLGGGILLSDYNAFGQSTGLLSELGFIVGTNASYSPLFSPFSLSGNNITTGAGSNNVNVTVTNNNTYYSFTASGGDGYKVGDEFKVKGSKLGATDGTLHDLTLRVLSINNPVTVAGVTTGGVGTVAYVSGIPKPMYLTGLGNWELLTYIANEGAPAALPEDGTNWFYSTATQVDIMVNVNGNWKGYKNVAFDDNGHPVITGLAGLTDDTGVITAAVAPTTQVSGADLVPGDLWLDTSDLENYPVLSRWQVVNGTAQWVSIDVTDQTTHSGIIFADARWGKDSTVDPVNDPIPSIIGLLSSDYLDLDAPDPTLYPHGMLLLNTRRSGYNVKQFVNNYFTQANYPDAQSLPSASYTWLSVSGLKADGSAYMGRKAQRHMVVKALKAAIGTNMQIREEDSFFNLIATPGYPELQPDMVSLNNERNNTGYIVGDTPLRLSDQATEITAWANNTKSATGTGEDGLVTRDEYMGIFYPSGIATDLTGSAIVVPASHMMLRTFLRNDTVSYPWLAAAGTRRGTIDNVDNIGYLDKVTGEFQVIKNRMAIRDVLYTHQINPLAFFTGVGLLNYGNKNSYASQSAMDRTNVARLVAYIRYQLQIAVRPFIFEPNDSLTRNQVAGVVQSLFVDLVAKRGLYDYLVVCDESNNTSDRIDRSELWIDVAIEPTKAAEFIYIPVRILNTGGIAKLK